jgi:glycerol-3-phosphate dehydrogenase
LLQRQHELGRLPSADFALAVIGGGATGVGCAIDAASRGLRVALLERDDLASGTSSRSTKLLHGGVRYLEAAVKHLDRVQFALVREALAERHLLLRLAPHLARELRLVTPLQHRLQAPYMWAGLQLYDGLAGRRRLTPCHHLSRIELARLCPALRPAAAGVAYSDGQFDDARFAVCAALTARAQGAIIATHVAVTGLTSSDGSWSVAWRDELDGSTGTVRARAVINAGGPFCDQIRRLALPQASPLLRVSSGIHLVLDRRHWRGDCGLLIPQTSDGRVLFALPWQGHLLVGTTDRPAAVESHPRVAADDIGYVLDQLNPYLRRPVTATDVRASWSGLRPLVAGSGDPHAVTKALSRDHLVHSDRRGLITVTGGKWTTYRRMAADAVFAACHSAGIRPPRPGRSHALAIVGGAGFHRLGSAWASGLPVDVAAHLTQSYGDRAPRVLALDAGRRERLVPGLPQLRCEIAWAAREEAAATAADVLCRRTRLAFIDTAAARDALDTVVEDLARELGWDRYRAAAEHAVCAERLATAI